MKIKQFFLACSNQSSENQAICLSNCALKRENQKLTLNKNEHLLLLQRLSKCSAFILQQNIFQPVSFHLVCINLLNISLTLLLFCFIVNYSPNDSRRDAWIKNSGNIELYGISLTQRRLFCEDHFDPKYLRCQFNRTTLRRDAVPYAHDDIQESVEIGEFL